MLDRLRRSTMLVAFLSAGLLIAPLQLAVGAHASEMLRFDVAEDPTRFSFDRNGPLEEDGLPDYGNAFVTQGYIYPHGTLVDGDAGVDVNGNPLYPDKVMGEWTCYGFVIGEGSSAETGKVAITEQVYSFGGDVVGSRTLVSSGYEIIDVNVPLIRAVTGGTGPYIAARGEVRQTTLAITELHSFTYRFEVELRD